MLSLLAPRGFSATNKIDDPRYWYSWVGKKTAAGVRVNEDVAMTYSAVWAATRLFGALGSVPLHMYRKTARGNERAPEHPVEKLFKWRFNGDMDAGSARRLLWHWQVNWGNAVCEKQYNDMTGEIAALIPICPWELEIKREEPSDELVYIIRDESDTRRLTADEVFHVPNIITYDGVIGCGTIRAARETIGFGLGTEKYGANWFGNGGMPRGVIEHPGPPLDPEKRKVFREEWDALHSGPEQYKVAQLGGGAKFQALNISAEDSQFLETRQHNIEEIARWYGVPPHLIWRMVQVTYNNAELLPLDFIKWTGLQYYEAWESAIATQLLTEQEREEYYAKHNLNGLLRGDSKTRMEFYKGMTSMAVFSRNRVRELEDEEPVEGGDTFLVQGAMVPLDADGKPQSDFAGTSGQQAAPASPPATDPNAAALVGVIKALLEERQQPKAVDNSAAVKRALHYQLTKAAEKEAKRAVEESRKAGSFVTQVDGFYSQHANILSEAVTPLLEALNHPQPVAFVSSWCDAGKQAVLSAADAARNAAELEASVKGVLTCSDWTDRPLKAITSLEN